MDARSLSLRRAWIEIVSPDTFRQKSESLSLRRAWIEIFTTEQLEKTATVALLTESVD